MFKILIALIVLAIVSGAVVCWNRGRRFWRMMRQMYVVKRKRRKIYERIVANHGTSTR